MILTSSAWRLSRASAYCVLMTRICTPTSRIHDYSNLRVACTKRPRMAISFASIAQKRQETGGVLLRARNDRGDETRTGRRRRDEAGEETPQDRARVRRADRRRNPRAGPMDAGS